ncbi:MAG: DUF1573 domain-containing protein [Planctomycetia bacterium]|nr:DUF1573 domain-containing protein [Planctomycetia bacterium]
MRKTQVILLFVVAGCAAVVAGTLAARWSSWFGTQSAPPPPVAQPDLVIDPQYLNFGEVWETDQFEWTLTVENRGSDTSTVTGLHGSCTCMSVTPSQFTLPPGQKQHVQVVLNLRSRSSQTDVPTQDDFAASLQANLRGKEKPVYWELRGRIRRSISTLDRIDLGSVSHRSPSAATQLLPVRSLSGSISSLEVKPSPPIIRTELSRGTGDSFQITVLPVTGLAKGKHESAVILTPVQENGERLPSIKVPVTFEVGEEVQATPQVIQFGGREVGQEAREALTLRSLGGLSFHVKSVRAEGNGLTVSPMEQDSGSIYEAVWRVTSNEPFEGRVIFDVVLADGDSFEVSVPVRGRGYRNP